MHELNEIGFNVSSLLIKAGKLKQRECSSSLLMFAKKAGAKLYFFVSLSVSKLMFLLCNKKQMEKLLSKNIIRI